MTILTKQEHIPDLGDRTFWALVDSDQVKQFAIVQIINALNAKSAEELNDQQCRSILSKLQGFADMINPTDFALPSQEEA